MDIGYKKTRVNLIFIAPHFAVTKKKNAQDIKCGFATVSRKLSHMNGKFVKIRESSRVYCFACFAILKKQFNDIIHARLFSWKCCLSNVKYIGPIGLRLLSDVFVTVSILIDGISILSE